MNPAPKLALLVNPRSGSGEGDLVASNLRSQGGEVDVYEVGQGKPSAASAARRAVDAGAARIVVAGGDGSIGEAAAAAGEVGVPLAVLPTGTANDFARSHDLPDEIDAATRLAALGQKIRPHDLGRVGGRPFVNVASAGLPPVAAREATGLKGALGSLAYPLGAMRAAIRAAPLQCVVCCDGEQVHDGEAWQVTVGCTGAFGGGAEIDADPRDGVLDLIVIPAGPRVTLVWRAVGLRSGKVDRQPEVGASRCREATLEVAAGTELNVDGEIVRTGSTRFTVEPHAFELVVG